jgi:CIC family chloride channel protein
VWSSRVNVRWRPSSFDIRTGEFRDLVRRSREVVLLAAITGALTGLFVRFFEYIVVEVVYERIVHAPLWVGAIAPGIGLVHADPAVYDHPQSFDPDRMVGATLSPTTWRR